MKKIINLLLIYNIFIITNAHAYLDPGTGSILVSAIVAGFVTIKTYWKMIVQKIKKFISKDKDNPKKID